MLEFDVTDALDEIENLGTHEKIEVLDQVCEELEAAIDELLSLKEEIEDQYKEEMEKKVDDTVRKYIEENGIQNSVKIKGATIECNYKDFGVSIFPFISVGECNLSIDLTRTVRHWHLEEIAETIDAHYDKKKGGITIPVSEDELIPKIIDIIQKLLIK